MSKEAPRGLERMKDFILHPLTKRPAPRKDRHSREDKPTIYRSVDPEHPDKREKIKVKDDFKIEPIQEHPQPEEIIPVAQPDREAVEELEEASPIPFSEMSSEELYGLRERTKGHWDQDPRSYEPDLDNLGYSDEDHFPGLQNPK